MTFTAPASSLLPTTSPGAPTARSANPSPLKSPVRLGLAFDAFDAFDAVEAFWDAPAGECDMSAGRKDPAKEMIMTRERRRMSVPSFRPVSGPVYRTRPFSGMARVGDERDTIDGHGDRRPRPLWTLVLLIAGF